MPRIQFGYNEAFDRIKTNKFKKSFYTNLTAPEARRAIKWLLDKANFMINVSPIKQSILNRDSDNTNYQNDIFLSGIHQGLTWVRANVDGTDDTGNIISGQPVVFDTVSAKCVTGINSKWGPDEYRIVGTAYKSLSPQLPGATKVKIPILVHPDPRPPSIYKFLDAGSHGYLYETLAYRSTARVFLSIYDYTLNDDVLCQDPEFGNVRTDLIVVARDYYLKDVSKTLTTGTHVWVQKRGSKLYVTQATC